MSDLEGMSRLGAPPTELTLMAHVARKHYVGGMSKSEIAEQLYISRFKVARLLDRAREVGVVRFEIGLPGDVNHSLSQELRDAFGLRHAVVIDDVDDTPELFRRLGAATVPLLTEIIRPGDRVGIASTRTLMGIEMPDRPIAPCSFVQLTGQLPRSDASDVIDAIRTLTRNARGTAQVFYAPMIAASPEAQELYMAQPEVAAAFATFDQLDVLVTGIGDWSDGMSVIHDHLPADVRAEAGSAGAVAEIAGVPIDADGHTVRGRARRHLVAPDAEMVAGSRDRLAVVFEQEKAGAVHLALRTGLVNSLVTHRTMAEALLVV